MVSDRRERQEEFDKYNRAQAQYMMRRKPQTPSYSEQVGKRRMALGPASGPSDEAVLDDDS